MEGTQDWERKLEAGKAKFAKYREQREKSAGNARDRKHKPRKAAGKGPSGDSSLGGVADGAFRPVAPHTLCGGESVSQEHSYVAEPESELYSSTTEEYSSEVDAGAKLSHGRRQTGMREEECEEEVTTPEISANQQQELNKLRLHVEELGKKLEEKQSTVQLLTNELQAMKARLPQEQLQIESAIKERDDVITRLTSSLQTARQSRDHLQDDAQLLTSQIHTLQLQLQQASETLRRSAHGNAVADLLQAQQQIIVYQETINEQGLHLRELQDEVKQHQEQLLLLQQQLVQAAVVSKGKEDCLADLNTKLKMKEDAIGELSGILKENETTIIDQSHKIREHESVIFELREKNDKVDHDSALLQDKLFLKEKENEKIQNQLSTIMNKERQSSNQVRELMGNIEELQKQYYGTGGTDPAELLKKMEIEMQFKFDQLRTEMDETHGLQLIQMKQQMREQHKKEVEELNALHRTELDRIATRNMSHSVDDEQIGLMNLAINELNIKLRESHLERDQLRQEFISNAEQAKREWSEAQRVYEDQILNLRYQVSQAHKQVESFTQAHTSEEQRNTELKTLTATIDELKLQLAEARATTDDLQSKHQQELTNYKIKLEMLEREKEAVLDRMAESQEAELERVHTELIFQHEEEMSAFKNQLESRNQQEIEGMQELHKRQVDNMQNNFGKNELKLSKELESLIAAKSIFEMEVEALKKEMSKLDREKQEAESKVQSELQKLHSDIEALENVEKEKGILEQQVAELQDKYKDILSLKESLDLQLSELSKDNEGLKKGVQEISSSANFQEIEIFKQQLAELENQRGELQTENVQLRESETALKEEMKRQRNLYAFSEKNFQVNLQELQGEHEQVLAEKKKIEIQLMQHEKELSLLKTQLKQEVKMHKDESSKSDALEEVQPPVPQDHVFESIPEKHAFELMEKLENSEKEKEELNTKLLSLSKMLATKECCMLELETKLDTIQVKLEAVQTPEKPFRTAQAVSLHTDFASSETVGESVVEEIHSKTHGMKSFQEEHEALISELEQRENELSSQQELNHCLKNEMAVQRNLLEQSEITIKELLDAQTLIDAEKEEITRKLKVSEEIMFSLRDLVKTESEQKWLQLEDLENKMQQKEVELKANHLKELEVLNTLLEDSRKKITHLEQQTVSSRVQLPPQHTKEKCIQTTTEQVGRSEDAVEAGRSEDAEEVGMSEETGRSEDGEEAGRSEDAEEAGRSEDAEEAGRSEDAEEAGRSEDAEEAGRSEDAEEAGRSEDAEEAGKTKEFAVTKRSSVVLVTVEEDYQLHLLAQRLVLTQLHAAYIEVLVRNLEEEKVLALQVQSDAMKATHTREVLELQSVHEEELRELQEVEKQRARDQVAKAFERDLSASTEGQEEVLHLEHQQALELLRLQQQEELRQLQEVSEQQLAQVKQESVEEQAQIIQDLRLEVEQQYELKVESLRHDLEARHWHAMKALQEQEKASCSQLKQQFRVEMERLQADQQKLQLVKEAELETALAQLNVKTEELSSLRHQLVSSRASRQELGELMVQLQARSSQLHDVECLKREHADLTMAVNARDQQLALLSEQLKMLHKSTDPRVDLQKHAESDTDRLLVKGGASISESELSTKEDDFNHDVMEHLQQEHAEELRNLREQHEEHLRQEVARVMANLTIQFAVHAEESRKTQEAQERTNRSQEDFLEVDFRKNSDQTDVLRVQPNLLQEKKETHVQEVDILKLELGDSGDEESDTFQKHKCEIEELKNVMSNDHKQEMEVLRRTLQESHQNDVELLIADLSNKRNDEINDLEGKLKRYQKESEAVKTEMEALKASLLEEHNGDIEELKISMAEKHQEDIEMLKAMLHEAHQEELEMAQVSQKEQHMNEINRLKEEQDRLVQELGDSFRQKLGDLHALEESGERDAVELMYQEQIALLRDNFDKEIQEEIWKLRERHDVEMAETLQKLQIEYDRQLEKEEEISQLQKELKSQLDVNRTQEAELDQQREVLEEEFQKRLEHMRQVLILQEEKHQEVLDHLHLQEEKQQVELIPQQTKRLSDAEEARQQEVAALMQRQQELLDQVSQCDLQIQQLQDEVTELHEQLKHQEGEFDTVLQQRERDNHENDTLVSLLRGDLEKSLADRDKLQMANAQLLKVLSEVVQQSLALEESIDKNVASLLSMSDEHRAGAALRLLLGEGAAELPLRASEPRSSTDSGSKRSESHWLKSDTSGVVSYLDEDSMELSQRLAESIFAGPGLETPGEDLALGSSNRLQVAVGNLLQVVKEATRKLEHAQATYTELLQETSQRAQAYHDLETRFEEEVETGRRLTAELHKAEGYLEKYSSEKRVLEEALQQRVAVAQQTEREVEELRGQLAEMRQQQQLVERQRHALTEYAGQSERGIVTDTEGKLGSGLLQETEKLAWEKLEVQRQAEKEVAELSSRARRLEVALEEQLSCNEELEEQRRAEVSDLQQQLTSLEKQLKKHRQFMEEQATDREHEREEFQQEIGKLEEQLKGMQRAPSSANRNNREVEQLQEQLRERTDRYSELTLVHKDLEEALQQRENEALHMEQRLQQLQKQQQQQWAKQQQQPSLKELCQDSVQCQDLADTAELSFKFDEQQDEVSHDDTTGSGLEQQLQQEREALERKDKEISYLEEQLEQFREELLNKAAEVEQLHMQLEVQRTEAAARVAELQELGAHEEAQQGADTPAQQKSMVDSEQQQPERLQEEPSDLDEEKELLEAKEEVIEGLQSQVEHLKDDQKQLRHEQAEEVEQLHEVIAKLQREFVHDRGGGDTTMTLMLEDVGNEDIEHSKPFQDGTWLSQELQCLKDQNRDLQEKCLALQETVIAKEAEAESLQSLDSEFGSKTNEDPESMQERRTEKEEFLSQKLGALQREHEALVEAQAAKCQELEKAWDRAGELKRELELQAEEVKSGRRECSTFEEQLACASSELAAAKQALHDNESRLALLCSETAAKQQELDLQAEKFTNLQEALQEHDTVEQKLREQLAKLEAELEKQRKFLTKGDTGAWDLQADVGEGSNEDILPESRGLVYAPHCEDMMSLSRDVESLSVSDISFDNSDKEHKELGVPTPLERTRQLAPSLTPSQLESSFSPLLDSALDSCSGSELGRQLERELAEADRLDSRIVGHLRQWQPEGTEPLAGGDQANLISRPLQTLLERVHGEGLHLLALSEQPPASTGVVPGERMEPWHKERTSLLTTISALRELLQKLSDKSHTSPGDWRADLVRAVVDVLGKERIMLLTTLMQHPAEFTRRHGEVLEEINNLEALEHKALEHLADTERMSLLEELQALQGLHENALNGSEHKVSEVYSGVGAGLCGTCESTNNLLERERQESGWLRAQLDPTLRDMRELEVTVNSLRVELNLKVRQLDDAMNNEKKVTLELNRVLGTSTEERRMLEQELEEERSLRQEFKEALERRDRDAKTQDQEPQQDVHYVDRVLSTSSKGTADMEQRYEVSSSRSGPEECLLRQEEALKEALHRSDEERLQNLEELQLKCVENQHLQGSMQVLQTQIVEGQRQLEVAQKDVHRLQGEVDRLQDVVNTGAVHVIEREHEKELLKQQWNELERVRQNVQRDLESALLEKQQRDANLHEQTFDPSSPRDVYNTQDLRIERFQLETIRQQLVLFASRIWDLKCCIAHRSESVGDVSTTIVDDSRTSEDTELVQIKQSLNKLQEELGRRCPYIGNQGATSALVERLVQQNSDLTGFLTRLMEEKDSLRRNAVRRTVNEQHAQHGSLASTQSPAIAREEWLKDKLAMQHALQESEAQIAQFRSQLHRNTLRRDAPDHDNTSTKLQKMYVKYLRAESFRKALIYQKKYLLLLLGGFQDCEQATLALIARMGAFPTPEPQPPRTHSRAFSRFRSAARVAIAVARLRFLVRKWQRLSRSTAFSRGQVNGLEQSPVPQLAPAHLHVMSSPPTRVRPSPHSAAHTLASSKLPLQAHGSRITSCSHPPGTRRSPSTVYVAQPDPERSLHDYIQRLETLQLRLGSVQTGTQSCRHRTGNRR